MKRVTHPLSRYLLSVLAGLWTAASLAAPLPLPSLNADLALRPVSMHETQHEANLPTVDMAALTANCKDTDTDDGQCADHSEHTPTVGLCDGSTTDDSEYAGVCPLPTLSH